MLPRSHRRAFFCSSCFLGSKENGPPKGPNPPSSPPPFPAHNAIKRGKHVRRGKGAKNLPLWFRKQGGTRPESLLKICFHFKTKKILKVLFPSLETLYIGGEIVDGVFKKKKGYKESCRFLLFHLHPEPKMGNSKDFFARFFSSQKCGIMDEFSSFLSSYCRSLRSFLHLSREGF